MENGFNNNNREDYRERKNKAIYIIVTAIVIVLASFLINNFQARKEVEKDICNVYFLDASEEFLKSEERYISGDSEEEIVANVLEILKNKPISEVLVQSIPENVEFKDYWIDSKGTVYIDLHFTDGKKPKNDVALMARAALVWTLTDLEFINGVCITIDGDPIIAAGGEYIGILTRDDLVIDAAEIITEPLDEVTVKLYFSNGDSTGLDVEIRRIIVNPNQELGGYVLTELIKGPVDENLKPTVPPETKVLDLKVLDGVCYVDLSSDFVTKHSGGTSEELLTIYSIVNSLTSIEGIDKVQFLIEGEKQTTFKGGVDFSIQFTAKDLYL
ncbi:MAG: GerMN domain-containing protein [Firmicutes bacterium]|nr:GerMN domain-containing protein [Bacillota bacterium]